MNEKKWLEIVELMPPMGMTSMLAAHCHFGYYENSSLGLNISIDNAHLMSPTFIKRLAEYINAVLGKATEITVYPRENHDRELSETWNPIDHQSIKACVYH